LNQFALEFITISKNFPGVHVIAEEHGAEKSTLMKIALGGLMRDKGTIKVFGKEVRVSIHILKNFPILN